MKNELYSFHCVDETEMRNMIRSHSQASSSLEYRERETLSEHMKNLHWWASTIHNNTLIWKSIKNIRFQSLDTATIMVIDDIVYE